MKNRSRQEKKIEEGKKGQMEVKINEKREKEKVDLHLKAAKTRMKRGRKYALLRNGRKKTEKRMKSVYKKRKKIVILCKTLYKNFNEEEGIKKSEDKMMKGIRRRS